MSIKMERCRLCVKIFPKIETINTVSTFRNIFNGKNEQNYCCRTWKDMGSRFLLVFVAHRINLLLSMAKSKSFDQKANKAISTLYCYTLISHAFYNYLDGKKGNCEKHYITINDIMLALVTEVHPQVKCLWVTV